MGSQEKYYPELDLDRQHGCIRAVDNAFSKEGWPGCSVRGTLPEMDVLLKQQALMRRFTISKGQPGFLNRRKIHVPESWKEK